MHHLKVYSSEPEPGLKRLHKDKARERLICGAAKAAAYAAPVFE